MDIEFLLWLQNLRIAAGGVLDALMEGASDFVIGTWTYIILGFIYWCIDKKAGSRMLLTLGGGSVVLQFMKNTFCVYRPWIRDFRIIPAGESIKTAAGYSFPSGHSITSMFVYGMLIYLVRKNIKNRKHADIMTVILAIPAITIGLSRIYLGVHFPTDVLAGWCLGVITIMVITYFTESTSSRN